MEEPVEKVANKYEEPMLCLTDQGDKFAIRCHQDTKKKYWYSAREIICNIHRDVMCPDDAEILFTSIFLELPHDRTFLTPRGYQFLGPYERPIPCITIQGLSVVYHYLDKQNLIIAARKAEFNKVIADCLAGNESKHVKMIDDGQVRIHEQELAQALLRGDGLNGRIPKGSIALFNPLLYLDKKDGNGQAISTLKQLIENQLNELKACKHESAQENTKLKDEVRRNIKSLKEMEENNEKLKAELMEFRVEEDRKRQKGEAFTLRHLVNKMNYDLTDPQFLDLSKRISHIMKEKHPDRQTFKKGKITFYYPCDQKMLEHVVTGEVIKMLADPAVLAEQMAD